MCKVEKLSLSEGIRSGTRLLNKGIAAFFTGAASRSVQSISRNVPPCGGIIKVETFRNLFKWWSLDFTLSMLAMFVREFLNESL